MDFVQRMKRALQRGRSATLPPDPNEACYVLLPYVMQNQIRPLSELLNNSNIDVNFQFGQAKRTLVHSSANSGAADCLIFLIKKGANVNLQDKIGVTPLHLAARNGHKKCVQKLVEAGADISVHDNEGLTALHWLACNGRTELLVGILQKGEFVDVEDAHGHTALQHACQNGHYLCAVQLLDYKADIHKHNKNGANALYFACRNGQVKCLRLLLEKGAKAVPNNDGISPLELCAKNEYTDCASLILTHYPDQIDHLLELVFREKIPEAKMQLLLEYLSKNSVKLLSRVLAKLASNTCTAGMELLSISSSYQDLMPQFLRAIRMLCALYKHYVEALKNETRQSPTNLSTPSSPAPHLSGSHSPSGASVRRAESFGSILDSPDVSQVRGGRLGRRFGHRRSHSQTLNPDDTPTTRENRAQTVVVASPESPGAATHQRASLWSHRSGKRSREPSLSITDPFEQLETVWSSLESWFDLLMMEVDKLQAADKAQGERDDDRDEEKVKEMDGNIDNVGESLITQQSPGGDSTTSRKPQLSLPTVQSSRLAAAIVQSAPIDRRDAFLRTSSSFDHSSPSLSKQDGSSGSAGVGVAVRDKRRSWHMENRFTTRYLASGGSLSSIPSFQRSLSSDSTQEPSSQARTEPSPLATVSMVMDPTATPSQSVDECCEEEDTSSLVEVYADRLCAVTHAFALCCATLQKSSGSSSGLYKRFLDFIDKYESVLKILLARSPQLIFAHFHFLLEDMQLLTRFMHIVHAQPFDDRKDWFYENLYKGKPPTNELTLATQANVIHVDREKIFTTSCERISDLSVDFLKDGLSIQFMGEAGMGSGVRREWFDNLSKEVLNPDYALFTQSADGATFQPNSLSDVNPDHLSYFKFAGRMMGLAIYHKQLLNVYFTRSFYKHILGIPVSYRDVESIDPEYANNLQWLLDNEIDALELGLTFCLETDVFGATEMILLKQGGNSLVVTDGNKREYVQLVTERRMTQAIGAQISSFLDGFYGIIPHELISLFDEYELELLMSGLPDIDVEDWERNTEYSFGYDENSDIIKWFWEIVRTFDRTQLAILLQFATGSSRVPLGGFTNLVGASGLTKFTVSRMDYSPHRLPMASTCFNLLKIPEYPTKEVLKERLNVALTCGSDIIDLT